MQLVDRDSLQSIRDLEATEVEKLQKGYGVAGINVDGFQELLSSISQEHAYVKCSCGSGEPSDPLVGIRKLGSGIFILANLPGRKAHLNTCPFSYHPNVKEPPESEEKQPRKEYFAFRSYDNGYITPDLQSLRKLYPTLISLSGMEKVGHYSDEQFFQQLVEGSRLHPEFIKSGLSKNLLFGYEGYRTAIEYLKTADNDSYKIVIQCVDGFDDGILELPAFEGRQYSIKSGEIIFSGNTTRGPFVAASLLIKKDGYYFPIASSIHSVYTVQLPLIVSGRETRAVLDALLGEKGLLHWIENKMNVSLEVNVNAVSKLSSISQREIFPHITIRCNQRMFLIGRPKKGESKYYYENGELYYFKSLHPLRSRSQEQIQMLKDRILSFAKSIKSELTKSS